MISLIITHWIGDALFQSERQATNKWKGSWELTEHILVYSLVMFIWASFALPHEKVWAFLSITASLHLVTDFLTSKVSHYLFERKIYYTGILNVGAFSVIVLDQALHFLQLLITYQWIIQQ